MAAPNSQPTSIGGMKAPNEHAPVEPALPATAPGDHGSPLHSMNPKASTPAPTGAGKSNPLH